MKLLKVAVVAAGLAFAAPALAQTPKPPPAGLTPRHIHGTGITVTDLEKQRDFYVQALGMTVLRKLERNGAVFEYILGYEGQGPDAAILALLKGTRKPGAETYGRILLNTPDADKLAAHLAAQGIPSRKAGQGIYFLNDPEGNSVELFQPQPRP